MANVVTSSLETLDGEALQGMFTAAAAALEAKAEAINALNVFPVPDGDTGTNMLLTMRAALEESGRSPGATASQTAAAMARGSLMGARGNSGVILSQILRGISKSVQGKDRLGGSDIVQALQEASTQAYKVVTEPVEGTILTVIREVAAAAQGLNRPSSLTPVAVLEIAASAARAAVIRTPFQLAVLRENGVVDAGGEGLAIILEGSLRFLRGGAGPEADGQRPRGIGVTRRPEVEHAAEEAHAAYGFCTEVLVQECCVGTDQLRDRLQSFGKSVLVAGDDALAKVHLHTFDTEEALAYLRSIGTVVHVKIDDIDEQHLGFTTRTTMVPQGEVGVVAVVAGDGLADLFRSLGAAAIVPGGQTMNPSVQDLLDAAQRLATGTVILLPNNANVIGTARQVQALGDGHEVHVVPTEDLPQGVAAMMAFNYEQDAEANQAALDRARLSVRTGAVTRAARNARIHGRKVAHGQFIGLAGGELAVTARDLDTTVGRLLARLEVTGDDAVTLYFGADVSQAQAEDTARRIRRQFPGVDVELFDGGQPHYHYLVSIE